MHRFAKSWSWDWELLVPFIGDLRSSECKGCKGPGERISSWSVSARDVEGGALLQRVVLRVLHPSDDNFKHAYFCVSRVIPNQVVHTLHNLKWSPRASSGYLFLRQDGEVSRVDGRGPIVSRTLVRITGFMHCLALVDAQQTSTQAHHLLKRSAYLRDVADWRPRQLCGPIVPCRSASVAPTAGNTCASSTPAAASDPGQGFEVAGLCIELRTIFHPCAVSSTLCPR